jgi:putative DNA primase/helicase
MADDLDTLLAKYAPEEVKRKTFQELLEAAEGFTPDYDPPTLTAWCKDVALSRADLAAESRLIREMKKRTKVSAQELRQMLSRQKGKHTSSDEDFGRLLCIATLERHFEKGAHIRRIAGDYLIFTGKLWERRTEDQLAWYVNSTLLELPNPDGAGHSAAIAQAMNLLRAVCSPPDDPFSLIKEPPNIINTQNYELWVRPDGTVEPHEHAHTSYQLSILDVNYDPHASCPMFTKALTEIFGNAKDPDGLVRHWFEIMGHIIQMERDQAMWLLLKGQGENGKTKVVETLMKLLGPTSTAVMPIQRLEEDRFAVAGLIGKKMVLDEDMNKNAHLPDGVLKSISERKQMEAEYKGRDRFAFICRTVPVMLSNHFPKTSDLSHGMMRRANIIPFSRQFKGTEADKGLFPRIHAQEMPGILNASLLGLQRLRARGRFDPPADCLRAVEVWANQVNPVKAFITDVLEPAPGCRLKWTDVYNRFREWAQEENLRFVPGRNTTKREFMMLGVRFLWQDGTHMVADLGLRAAVDMSGDLEREQQDLM